MYPTARLRHVLLLTGLLALTACGDAPPDSAFYNRGGPESLLDVSSEVVNLSVASDNELKDLAAWVERDRPTRAEVNCSGMSRRCDTTRRTLDLGGVPYTNGVGNDQSVTLVYERILARDCKQEMKLDRPNYYNTPHRALGCSVAANMVQQVTDKQEFVSPNLSDDPSAVRGVNDMRRAYTPREIIPAYKASTSVVNTGGSN